MSALRVCSATGDVVILSRPRLLWSLFPVLCWLSLALSSTADTDVSRLCACRCVVTSELCMPSRRPICDCDWAGQTQWHATGDTQRNYRGQGDEATQREQAETEAITMRTTRPVDLARYNAFRALTIDSVWVNGGCTLYTCTRHAWIMRCRVL